MYRAISRRCLIIAVLFIFMLSSGVFGALLNLFDLATCPARGGKVVGRNDQGDT